MTHSEKENSIVKRQNYANKYKYKKTNISFSQLLCHTASCPINAISSMVPLTCISKIECHNANLVSKDKTEMGILKSKHRPSPCILSHQLAPAPDFPPLPLIHTQFQVLIQTHGCTASPIQKLDWQSLTSLTQFLPSFDTLTFLV